MQIEQQDENFYLEKHFSEKPLFLKFMPEQNLLGILFKNQIEFYRIEPTFELIAEIKGANMLGLQNGKPIDFCFSNDLKNVVYSVSGKKTFITNIEENNDEKPVSIFGLASKELINLKIFQTKETSQTYYNCFKGINFASQNFLDKIFNCSLTHLFTFKENLAKIKNLQKLLNKEKNIFILTGVEGQNIKMAFNNTVEFMNLKLNEKVNIDSWTLNDYTFNKDNMQMNFYLQNEQKNQIRKIETQNIFNQYGIENTFFISYNLTLITEILKNLKMGYFKTKMNFTELSSRLKTFLQELDLLEDEQNLNNFRNFLKYGLNKTQNIQSFYELLGIKKINEFYNTINNKFDLLEDFYDESFQPGFKKILAMLKDLELIQDFQMNDFFNKQDLKNLQNLSIEIIIHIKKFLVIFQKKKLQIKNFIIFLFKWIFQEDVHTNAEDIAQYQFFIQSIVDYKLLFEYLKDDDSVYMTELKESILDKSLIDDEINIQQDIKCNNQKLIDKFKKIRSQLRLSNDSKVNMIEQQQEFQREGMKKILNQFQINLNKVTKGFRENLNKKTLIQSDEVIINTDMKIDYFKEIKKDDQEYLIVLQNNFMTVYNNQQQKNFYELQFIGNNKETKSLLVKENFQLVIGSLNLETNKYQIDQLNIEQFLKQELRGTTIKIQQSDKNFTIDGYEITQLTSNSNGYTVLSSKDKIFVFKQFQNLQIF